MTSTELTIPSTAKESFSSFILGKCTSALPLKLRENVVHALPVIESKTPEDSFQTSLNHLDDVLDLKTPLFLLLRRHNSVTAITFVPYQARKDECEIYLRYREDLVRLLGEDHFETSMICKEIGEITDARSWNERDAQRQDINNTDVCRGEDAHGHKLNAKDSGYKKNKCRLCDRRMKNKITDEALQAIKKLEEVGNCVQISLSPDLVLGVDLYVPFLSPEQVATQIPTTHPTFTFYRHPNKLLYFIFHSPDLATVQQRMKHTMAIPGLVNVHTEDCGVHVDHKIEIHEPEDLVFEASDKKVGRFRSVYLRGKWRGTESQYEGLERDKLFYDTIE